MDGDGIFQDGPTLFRGAVSVIQIRRFVPPTRRVHPYQDQQVTRVEEAIVVSLRNNQVTKKIFYEVDLISESHALVQSESLIIT